MSIGFQLGGRVYSQIIFFEDRRAFDDFSSGNFEVQRPGRRSGDYRGRQCPELYVGAAVQLAPVAVRMMLQPSHTATTRAWPYLPSPRAA